MVANLPHYDEWDEALNVLITRDLIEDNLQAGRSISSDEAELLTSSDRTLVDSRTILLRRFPEVFEASDTALADRWWWQLDTQVPNLEPVRTA